MREAAVPDYKLGKSKRSTRLLITLAILGVLSGLLSSVGVTLLKTGITPQDVADYYHPVPVAEAGSVDALLYESTGPSFVELAEVTHLHLMGGTLLLFLLCHLLSLCSIRDSTRVLLYVVAWSSFLLTFLSPWIIVYVTRSAAPLYSISVVILVCSISICSIVPVREMWWR